MVVDRGAINEMSSRLSSPPPLVKGIVSREDLALMFNKNQRTIMRWAERHDFKHVDGPDQRKIYYDIEDIKRRVRNGAAPETD